MGIAEYGKPRDILPTMAAALRETASQSELRLRRAGERIQRHHGLAHNPIEIADRRVTAKGVAGIVSLAESVDLEIRPKFAGEGDDWRADLTFLALFAAHGRVDPIRSISSTSATANTLADLVARTLLAEMMRNQRAPLRIRRRCTAESFEPEGELDPETLLDPREEGWAQSRYAMTRNNEYWATIRAGADALLGHVRDVEVAGLLRNAVSRWGLPATKPSRARRLLPPRLARWQKSYDLAFQILKESGFAPGAGRFSTFEFTIDTWRTWEALVERSLVLALGASRVDLQRDVRLGTIRRGGATAASVVRPDALVRIAAGVVVDAKYKGNEERGGPVVSAADRYEAMAFMHATGTRHAILVYPGAGEVGAAGQHVAFQTEALPTGRLEATRAGVGGIAGPGGLAHFSSALARLVLEVEQVH